MPTNHKIIHFKMMLNRLVFGSSKIGFSCATRYDLENLVRKVTKLRGNNQLVLINLWGSG